MGAAATEHLTRGEHGILAGLVNGTIAPTPLAEVVARKKQVDLNLLELARALNK
jgi:hypothetical protein